MIPLEKNGLRFFTLPQLANRGVLHAFGTIDFGDRPSLAHARLRLAFPELREIVTMRQVHGRSFLVVKSEEEIPALRKRQADILVTRAPGIGLCVRTADCAPLLIWDPKKKAVAAVHAGWRGTALRVAKAAVQAMQEEYGSRAGDLVVGIGPCILPCHYQVDDPVISAFREALGPRASQALLPDHNPNAASLRQDSIAHARLDLSLANRIILEQAGVPREQIEELKLCTFCHPDLFFSYRRQGRGVPSLYHFIAVPA